jgi:hypothetical protein
MVRAGDVPLDRAHAHARWAGRYDAQGNTQRAAAHFGRAMHYAQVAHAFGARDLGNVDVGMWEHGAEAWYTLQDLYRYEGLAAETKRRRMQQVLRGHGPRPLAAAGPASYVYRVLPGLLDALYTSESSGSLGKVHCDAERNWYIHRARTTLIVYLVPAPFVMDKDDVSGIVEIMGNSRTGNPYTSALSEGLLIVQDRRPGCVRVKRGGLWEPATRVETFAYYDFLLRYPSTARHYHLERGAPAHTVASEPSEQSDHAYLTFTRNDVGIFVCITGDDSGGITPDQISDVAWRATSEGRSLNDPARLSGIIDSGPGERGFLYE